MRAFYITYNLDGGLKMPQIIEKQKGNAVSIFFFKTYAIARAIKQKDYIYKVPFFPEERARRVMDGEFSNQGRHRRDFSHPYISYIHSSIIL